MKVLIDTNVLIDFLTKRAPFYKDAKEVLMKCTHEDIEGFVAMHTISNLWYILRNEEAKMRIKCIKIICLALTVCFTTHNEVYNIVKNELFDDLEDGLQEACAYTNKMDYIVTRNVKDFKNSRIKALTPAQFINNNSV
ncbi:MAG: PIN domain-containing protein [Lachnospiraceae bacterium]|nr:PIN domain-containing protein [Lachnospiraceae bacterium]